MWLRAPENDYRPLFGLPSPAPTLPVAVCMPVYNRVDLLARTVAGLAAQTYPAELLEVVVGDDGSDEDVEAAVAPFRDRLRIAVHRRDHSGYGAGHARNLAARNTTAEVLVFVDADCLPDRDLVSNHAVWHHLAENLVVIGSRHGLDTSSFTLAELASGSAALRTAALGGEDLTTEAVYQVDHRRPLHRRTAGQRHGDEAFRSLVSSNFSVRRDRFLEVGGFDETFTRWSYEDVELGWRCHTAGLYTVVEDRAVVFHQLQEDLWDQDGRKRSRELNAGVVRNKIPHAFYRKPRPGSIWEVPKVSVVVVPTVPARLEEVFAQLVDQSLDDWELVVMGGSPEATLFAETTAADPRCRVIDTDDPLDLMREARGEYVALVHGDAAYQTRMLAEGVHKLDAQRRFSAITCPYLVGTDIYRSEEDRRVVERAWNEWGMPVFHLARRREWSKALHGESDPRAVMDHLGALTRVFHLHEPLVRLRSGRPDGSVGEPLTGFTTRRGRLADQLRAAGGTQERAKAVGRYLLRREPQPVRPRARPPRDGKPVIRYVGWTGKDNLGDEVLLQAITGALAWGEVRTAKRGDLLLLGGGTLINRGNWITWLEEHDSPRIERAIFGTGVANPEFWGERPDRDRWTEWLGTCVYRGVRGPISAALLADWGVEAEVVGDAALLVRPAATRREGLVVMAPCRTRGELWGGDDDAVFARMADTTRHLLDRGREVVLMSAHPDDDGPCIDVMRRAGRPDLGYAQGYADLDAAVDLLASADLVVAERLHAAVLGAAGAVPFVALEYRPKLRDFAASMGMEDRLLRTDRLGGLEAAVDDALADRAALSDRIAARVEDYRSRLTAAAGHLRQAMEA